jgi:hypothetical protein
MLSYFTSTAAKAKENDTATMGKDSKQKVGRKAVNKPLPGAPIIVKRPGTSGTEYVFFPSALCASVHTHFPLFKIPNPGNPREPED